MSKWIYLLCACVKWYRFFEIIQTSRQKCDSTQFAAKKYYETTGLISCQPRSCCLKTTGEVVFAAAGRIALQGRADEGMLVCESWACVCVVWLYTCVADVGSVVMTILFMTLYSVHTSSSFLLLSIFGSWSVATRSETLVIDLKSWKTICVESRFGYCHRCHLCILFIMNTSAGLASLFMHASPRRCRSTLQPESQEYCFIQMFVLGHVISQ